MPIIAPLSLTPDEFEIAVKRELQQAGADSKTLKLKVHGKRDVKGIDGDYELDASAEFELFNVQFKTLIECKRFKRPVTRDYVMTLWAKLQSTAMHKGIMFSTSGFQRSAVLYAKQHGIALIHMKSGSSSVLAKSERFAGQSHKGEYASWVLFPSEDGVSESLLARENPRVLHRAFLPEKIQANEEDEN